MATEDMVAEIISLTADMMNYMIPIVAVLAGINFMISWFHSVVFGAGKRTFKD